MISRQGPVSIRKMTDANRLVDGNTAFIWEPCRSWPKVLIQRCTRHSVVRWRNVRADVTSAGVDVSSIVNPRVYKQYHSFVDMRQFIGSEKRPVERLLVSEGSVRRLLVPGLLPSTWPPLDVVTDCCTSSWHPGNSREKVWYCREKMNPKVEKKPCFHNCRNTQIT